MRRKADLPYDDTSVQSILDYGKLLLGHSLRELHPDAKHYQGKGGMGNSVEYNHFEYEPNNDPRPDFPEAGLELKCPPLKLLKDDSMAAKERLVLNIINYMEESQKDFETSSFWNKNKHLLLMFYLHEGGVDILDMIFKLVRTWQFPAEDLKIIKDDWTTIHKKILDGKADELSESDTFYLAACTKGTKAGKEMREQPCSPILAQQRAYSLKEGYMNKVILFSYLDTRFQQDLHINSKRIKQLQKKYDYEKVVKDVSAYRKEETFVQLIERRMKPFYGKSVAQISQETKTDVNPNSKALAYDVCRAILGIKKKKIQEFEVAGVALKSIALEAERDYVKESMSFPYIRFVDIVEQEWEESEWYRLLTSKFLFVVFRKSVDGDKLKMKLQCVFFWNMPKKDLVVAEKLWNDTKRKVVEGDYENFITTKSHPVCHVRPHGTKGQTVATPQGTRKQPKCFWLNNDYILSIIKNRGKI